MNQSIVRDNFIIHEIIKLKQLLQKVDKDILHITEVCNRNVNHLDYKLQQMKSQMNSQMDSKLQSALVLVNNDVNIQSNESSKINRQLATLQAELATLQADYRELKNTINTNPLRLVDNSPPSDIVLFNNDKAEDSDIDSLLEDAIFMENFENSEKGLLKGLSKRKAIKLKRASD